MERLYEFIYFQLKKVRSVSSERFTKNTLEIFNASADHFLTLPERPVKLSLYGDRVLMKYTDQKGRGCVSPRTVRMLAGAYGLLGEIIPLKKLEEIGMGNPSNAIADARFELSGAINVRFGRGA